VHIPHFFLFKKITGPPFSLAAISSAEERVLVGSRLRHDECYSGWVPLEDVFLTSPYSRMEMIYANASMKAAAETDKALSRGGDGSDWRLESEEKPESSARPAIWCCSLPLIRRCEKEVDHEKRFICSISERKKWRMEVYRLMEIRYPA